MQKKWWKQQSHYRIRKKGEDIRVIDISGVTVIADYFIIASGSNPNQVQALVDNVEEQMYKAGYDDPRVEAIIPRHGCF